MTRQPLPILRLAGALLLLLAATGPAAAQITPRTTVMWINSMDFYPNVSSLKVTPNDPSFGIGLVVQSTALGDNTTDGLPYIVSTGLQVPPGYLIKGVRVCYLSYSGLAVPTHSFITSIRLAQLQNPPSTALVMLDDGTDLTNPGPICVNSQSTTVDPTQGAVNLDLRFYFGDTSNRIVIRSVGLLLAASS